MKSWIILVAFVIFPLDLYAHQPTLKLDKKKIAKDLLINKNECLIAIDKTSSSADDKMLIDFQKELKQTLWNCPHVLLEKNEIIKEQFKSYFNKRSGCGFILVYDLAITEDKQKSSFKVSAGAQLIYQNFPHDSHWSYAGERYSVSLEGKENWAQKAATDLWNQVNKTLESWLEIKVSLVQEGNPIVCLGEPILYTITLKNTSATPLKNLIIRNPIPSGLTYKEHQDGFILKWNLNTLYPGEEKKYQYTLLPTRIGTFTNITSVSVNEEVVNKAELTTKVAAPDVFILKEGNAEVRIGQAIVYTLTVRNTGNIIIKNLEIRDQIAPGLMYQGKKNGFYLKWNLSTLNPGEEKKYQYTLLPLRSGSFITSATVSLHDKVLDTTEFITEVLK